MRPYRVNALRILFLVGLAFAVTGAGRTAAERPERAQRVPTAVVSVSQNDSHVLIFDLETPGAIVAVDGGVTVSGLTAYITQVGAPELPIYRTLIAVPPGATATASAQVVDARAALAGLVRTVPRRGLSGAPPEEDGILVTDPATLRETAVPVPLQERTAADVAFPPDLVTLGQVGQAGDLRVAELSVYPLRYTAASGLLWQATKIQVRIDFSGAQLAEQGHRPEPQDVWQKSVLNPPPPTWRSRPAEDRAEGELVALPQGVETFKIEVNQDGIHEISGADLAAAGMSLEEVDVDSLQLMHRGQPVAYEFVEGGGSSALEAQDKIRFFGWSEPYSRAEDMYEDRHYFWLWAGGSATRITAVANESDQGHEPLTAFPERIAKWPHNGFFSGWGIDWTAYGNEPTAWHWDRQDGIRSSAGGKVVDYTIDLPDPVPGATEQTFRVELTSRLSTIGSVPAASYEVQAALNADPKVAAGGGVSWKKQGNVNLIAGFTGDALLQPGDAGYPANRVSIWYNGMIGGNPNGSVSVYLTQIAVEYLRQLVAVSDELLFGQVGPGKFAFRVRGFTTDQPAEALVWDVSDRLNPVAIRLGSSDISGAAGDYTWEIRRTVGDDDRLIATTAANTRKPIAITKVVSGPLGPANGARWVAIAHSSLIPAAEVLAAHRTAVSQMTTWTIDIEEIINQIGYGYHVPAAIQSYLRTAYTTWPQPPGYVVLFGDATVNPRGLPCTAPGCQSAWNVTQPHLATTDLAFIDRFNGLIPVDHTFSTLVGEDLYPEVALARIPAESLGDAQAVVEKIVRYELGFDGVSPQQTHYLFVADNTDGAGDFCAENAMMAATLPQSIQSTQLCLPNVADMDAATAVMRQEMFAAINDATVGVQIMSYRGHGNVSFWAAPKLMTTADTAAWMNAEPLLLISADCLDGYFVANYDLDGLGETYVRLPQHGTVGHWSSTGLGYTYEHTILHEGFFEAIHKHGLSRSGDAVNYAKARYLTLGLDASEAQSFTLLGDPAMNTIPPTTTVSGQITLQGRDEPGSEVRVRLIDLDQRYGERTVEVDSQTGTFSLGDVRVAAGGSSYEIVVERDLYLGKSMQDVFTEVPRNLPPTTLRGGDATNDGRVDQADLDCMAAQYGQGAETCWQTGSSDVNGDGRTDILDLSLAGGNFGLRSFDVPWQP